MAVEWCKIPKRSLAALALLSAGLSLLSAAAIAPAMLRVDSYRLDISQEFRVAVETASASSNGMTRPYESIPPDRWGSNWVYDYNRGTMEGRVWSAGPDKIFMRGGDDVLLVYAAPSWLVSERDVTLNRFELLPGTASLVFCCNYLQAILVGSGGSLLLTGILIKLVAWLHCRRNMLKRPSPVRSDPGT